jgi:hypothetical protein
MSIEPELVEPVEIEAVEDDLILHDEPKPKTTWQNKATQIKPGEVRNPAGRPVGSVNLSTIVDRMMTRGEIDWSKVPVKGGKKVQDRMLKKYGKRGWVALSYVAYAQALQGDANARKWLSDAAYGNKMEVNIQGSNAPQGEIPEEMRAEFLEYIKSKTKA